MMDTYIKNTTTTALEMQELHVKDSSSTSDEILELYRYNGSTADLVYEKFTPATGPTILQSITWTMTNNKGSATVSNHSGLDIISPNRTAQLQIAGGPRLWNGSEAANAGATASGSTHYVFSTGGDCLNWWDDYWVRARQNGGSWVDLVNASGTIYLSCQPGYNNIGQGQSTYDPANTWLDMRSTGMVIDFQVYAVGDHP